MKYHNAVRGNPIDFKGGRKQKQKLSCVEDFEALHSYAPIGFAVPDNAPPIILYVYDDIGPQVDYVEFCHSLRYAEPGQQIAIHINSPGGNLYTCLSIINAIEASSAEITTIVDGQAASAAAMIWLAGHTKLIASRHVEVMLHGASTAYGYAKTSEINNSTKATDKIVEALLDDLSMGFLTPEERDDIRKGVDVYLTGTDIIERLKLDQQEEDDGSQD